MSTTNILYKLLTLILNLIITNKLEYVGNEICSIAKGIESMDCNLN